MIKKVLIIGLLVLFNLNAMNNHLSQLSIDDLRQTVKHAQSQKMVNKIRACMHLAGCEILVAFGYCCLNMGDIGPGVFGIVLTSLAADTFSEIPEDLRLIKSWGLLEKEGISSIKANIAAGYGRIN